jgi:phosphatidate cytidylyltransferase
MKNQSINRAHLQRWLTAAIAVPLLAFIIGFGPGWLLLVAILLLDFGGMLELSTLVLSGTSAGKRAAVSSMGLILPLATYWKGALGLTLAIVVVLFVSLLVHLFLYAKHETSLTSLGAVIFAQLYIPFLLSHLLLLFPLPSGRRWIFFVLLVIFAGDTGAYYIGHRWGKRRLWPSVSPGKTVEGAVGGLLTSLFIALIAGKSLLSTTGFSLKFILVLALAMALLGQIGDLMESMLKRVSQVKDASGLLPGHGGLLDRLDSLIFAFPLTYYSVVLFS